MLDILNSTSHVIQLLIALSLAIVLFVAAFSGYGRALFLGLLVMIPFQPIDTKYGSLNMVLTWLVGFSVLLDSIRHRSAGNGIPPMIWQFGLLVVVFLMSMALAPRMFLMKYLIHTVVIGSNIVLFYLSYWYIRNEHDVETFFRALIISNVLVALYTGLQLIIGIGTTYSLGGIQELSLLQNRWDQRLSGPFLAVGITAEYLVIQSLILVHYMVQTGRLRRLGLVLLTLNFAILVGTGNRGGFLVSILALFLFLYHYRRYIGQRGVMLAFIGFFVFGGLASFVMVEFTEFDVLFSRLAGTEIHGITPDDRQGWSVVVKYIADEPVLGHGPRIVIPEEYDKPPTNWPKTAITFYPHNLYLYILYTTGVIGLVAYAIWGLSYWRSLNSLRRRWDDTRYRLARGLPTLGLIIFVVFLVDQYKVEFLRYYLLDYQHFLAALFAMFLALRKLDANTHRAAARAARNVVAG